MEPLANYISGVFIEGLLVGVMFWLITMITVESSSLWGAVRSAVLAETIGNIPYFWDLPATSPPGIAMTLVGAVIFVRLVLGIGELTPMKAVYGTAMTYFLLVALVTCAG